MNKQVKKNGVLWYIILHTVILLYSTGGIFSKLASRTEFLSWRFCILYSGVIAVLGIYAIVWQQVLKHFDLSTAFCNKAVTIVWGIIWGALLFGETVKWNMLLGAAIVILGVILVVTSDE